MRTRMMGMLRWLAGLVQWSPEELKQAGVYLDRLND
jgi:hypothetical protein